MTTKSITLLNLCSEQDDFRSMHMQRMEHKWVIYIQHKMKVKLPDNFKFFDYTTTIFHTPRALQAFLSRIGVGHWAEHITPTHIFLHAGSDRRPYAVMMRHRNPSVPRYAICVDTKDQVQRFAREYFEGLLTQFPDRHNIDELQACELVMHDPDQLLYRTVDRYRFTKNTVRSGGTREADLKWFIQLYDADHPWF